MGVSNLKSLCKLIRMVKTPYVDKNGIRKGTWSEEEDEKLKDYINKYGCVNWRQLPKFAGLSRCGKSCRLRWMNYLRPDVKRGNFSDEEENIIVKLHESLGNRWSIIAAQLPGRSDNEVKNYWHSFLKKREKKPRDHNRDNKSKRKRRVHCKKSKPLSLEENGSPTSTNDVFVVHGILESSNMSSNSNWVFNQPCISNESTEMHSNESTEMYSNVTEIDPITSMFSDGNGVFSNENDQPLGDFWMDLFMVSNSENNSTLSSVADLEYLIHEPFSPREEDFPVSLW